MTKVFISYSHDDAAWVLELWRLMRDRLQYDPWIDQKIVPATDWWASILTQIKASECFLVVMTQKSTQSIYCQAELEYALRLNKPILPLMLKECVPFHALTERRIQYKDLTDNKPLNEVLIDISLAVGRINSDVIMGVYPPKEAEPLPEPKARDAATLSDLLAKAHGAMVDGHIPLAEQLCKRVIDSGNVVMAQAAKQLYEQINRGRERADAYQGVKLLLGGGSFLASTAPAAWHKLVELYGREPDPDDLAGKVGEIEQTSFQQTSPQTSKTDKQPPAKPQEKPAPPVQQAPPPPPDPVQEALTRAREFAQTGKLNKDWTPFYVVFDDVKRKGLDMPFCLVPTGTFQMGSDDGHWANEQPVHPQTFKQPFYIAQTPVTNAQWKVAVAAGVVNEPEYQLEWYDDPAMANAPVVGVNWFQCQKFAQWLGCRLPTEREWEYAARGIQCLRYPWGNDWDENKAVWSGNSDKPNDVRSKSDGASWVGALHMSGNVWEWCASLYEPYPYPIDGSRERDRGDSTDVQRVLRGGAWWLVNIAFLRAACRNGDYPNGRNIDGGFRVARS